MSSQKVERVPGAASHYSEGSRGQNEQASGPKEAIMQNSYCHSLVDMHLKIFEHFVHLQM